LGLRPLQKSSGGKERLDRISKMRDKYMRKLLILGMISLGSPGKVQSQEGRSTLGGPARTQTCAGRDRRDGEQDSADRLGGHGTWRDRSCRPPASIGDINQRLQGLAEGESAARGCESDAM
jgi:hypothetical protein